MTLINLISAAMQFVIEDKIMRTYSVEAMLAVGWEGFFGTLTKDSDYVDGLMMSLEVLEKFVDDLASRLLRSLILFFELAHGLAP